MRLIFQFEPSEIAAIKSIVDERVGLGRRMVVYRIENNVSGPVPDQIKMISGMLISVAF